MEAICRAASAENVFYCSYRYLHFLKEQAPLAHSFKNAEPKLGNWPTRTNKTNAETKRGGHIGHLRFFLYYWTE